MTAAHCDGTGKLRCTCPASYHPVDYACRCDLACPGCPKCSEFRRLAALKAAREQAELEAWYQAKIGTRQPEAKGGRMKANGDSQGRMF